MLELVKKWLWLRLLLSYLVLPKTEHFFYRVNGVRQLQM